MKVVEYLGITAAALERACGWSGGTVTTATDGLSAKKIAALHEAYPEINITWLITGKGEMLNSKLTVSAKASGGSSANAVLGNGNIIGDNSPSLSLQSENAVLKRENEILREQIDFLKKLLTK